MAELTDELSKARAQIAAQARKFKSAFLGCYPLHLMVNPGGLGAYPAQIPDNILNTGVIHPYLMQQPQPPRLLDQVRQSIRLKHFSLKTEKS